MKKETIFLQEHVFFDDTKINESLQKILEFLVDNNFSSELLSNEKIAVINDILISLEKDLYSKEKFPFLQYKYYSPPEIIQYPLAHETRLTFVDFFGNEEWHYEKKPIEFGIKIKIRHQGFRKDNCVHSIIEREFNSFSAWKKRGFDYQTSAIYLCPVCLKWFFSIEHGFYCSPECIDKKKQKPQKSTSKLSKKCLNCGTVFETYNDKKKTCSDKCRKSLSRGNKPRKI